jgi:hypothetical protein
MSAALSWDNCVAKESTLVASPLSAAWQIESNNCSSSATLQTRWETSPPMDSPSVGRRVGSTIFAPPCLQKFNFMLEGLPKLREGIGTLNFKISISGFEGQISHQEFSK